MLDLASQLADAIVAAHQQGIVHRDLKPSNIMVGDDGRLKVLDFGIAKRRQKTTGGTETTIRELTAEHGVIGTASYMSPEQAEGRPVDHRADIFSFGIVLYEMATGVRPFKGESTTSIRRADCVSVESRRRRHLRDGSDRRARQASDPRRIQPELVCGRDRNRLYVSARRV